jgi:hypothetical protein
MKLIDVCSGLRELQTTYYALIRDVQAVLNAPPSAPAHGGSPGFAPPKRPTGRSRSNTSPTVTAPSHAHLASALHTIAVKYRIAWECAELLIELAGGPPAEDKPVPTSSMSEPLVGATGMPPLGHTRERTITLESVAAGEKDAAWTSSTGRNDFSRRQLLLLRDMLQGTEALAAASAPEGLPAADGERPPSVNRTWRWGDPASSTITLPSEENAEAEASPLRKRQSGMKLGMRGLRDMLRGLKKQNVVIPTTAAVERTPRMAAPAMEKTSSTGSSQNGAAIAQTLAPSRPRSKTGSAAQSLRSTNAVPPPVPSDSRTGTVVSTLGHKPSPRRPSLASIFRLGQRQRSGTGPAPSTSSEAVPTLAAQRNASGSSRPSSTSSEEDWDRIDSASDVDGATGLGIRIGGAGTVRVPSTSAARQRSPYAQGRSSMERSPTTRRPPLPTASQSSIFTDAASSVQSHGRKLSNVAEQAGAPTTPGVSRRASVRSNRGGSVRVPLAPAAQPMSVRARSAPQTQAQAHARGKAPAHEELPDPQLAMTPENIRPLLENAREVQARLAECVDEVRGLLAARS